MRIYELIPVYDSRKSFYGKAHVLDLGGGCYQLQSYNTIVAEIQGGKITKNGIGCYSVTTTRHVKEFFRQFDIDF